MAVRRSKYEQRCLFCGTTFTRTDGNHQYCSPLCSANALAYYRQGKRFPHHDRHHEDPSILLRSTKQLTPAQEKICTDYIYDAAEKIRLARPLPEPHDLT